MKVKSDNHWMSEMSIRPASAAYCPEDSGIFVRFHDGLTGFLSLDTLVGKDIASQLIPEKVYIEPTGSALSIPMTNGEICDVDPLVIRSLFDESTKQRLTLLELEYAADCGQTIRDKRLASGWTQVELSQRSGLDQAVISKLERGLHAPRISTLDRIARAFGLNEFRSIKKMSEGANS